MEPRLGTRCSCSTPVSLPLPPTVVAHPLLLPSSPDSGVSGTWYHPVKKDKTEEFFETHLCKLSGIWFVDACTAVCVLRYIS